MNVAYNMDCMEGMMQYPDGYFDLAVVDPVYGDVPSGGYMTNNGGGAALCNAYHNAVWQQPKTPPEYFTELFRVSKNQIIWGANYFVSEIGRSSPGWIIWDKCRPEGVNYADCEIAYTSFLEAARIFRYRWNGFVQQNMKHREVRIHPTQKPTDLYRWIYRNYAKTGDKILDTHLGSGTSRRAAHDFGFDFVGFELDKTYFDLQEQAFNEYTSQLRIVGL